MLTKFWNSAYLWPLVQKLTVKENRKRNLSDTAFQFNKPVHMSWFKRLKEGVTTATKSKKDVPQGIWFQCKSCKETSTAKEFQENWYKCPKCDYHSQIGSQEYFEILFDENSYKRLFDELASVDFLNFTDLKQYS